MNLFAIVMMILLLLLVSCGSEKPVKNDQSPFILNQESNEGDNQTKQPETCEIPSAADFSFLIEI